MPEATTPAAAPAATTATPPAPAATITSPDALAADGNTELISLEEARKLRSEAQALRKRLKAFEDAEQAAKDAQLGEVERMAKERAALQEQYDNALLELQEARIFQAVAQNAGKHNFAIPHDMIVRLLNWDDIEFDEASGKPTNVHKLLEKLAHDAPDLVKNTQLEQQQQRRAPMIPAMSPERSSIAQPGQNQQKTRSLFDPGLWKT